MITGEKAELVDSYLPYLMGMFFCGGAFVGGLLIGVLMNNPIGLVGVVIGIIGMITIFSKSNVHTLKLHGKWEDDERN